jgi:hypothetical protein
MLGRWRSRSLQYDNGTREYAGYCHEEVLDLNNFEDYNEISGNDSDISDVLPFFA